MPSYCAGAGRAFRFGEPMSVPDRDLDPPDERHCSECCLDSDCPGNDDDPILHSKTCGRHIREARDERRGMTWLD